MVLRWPPMGSRLQGLSGAAGVMRCSASAYQQNGGPVVSNRLIVAHRLCCSTLIHLATCLRLKSRLATPHINVGYDMASVMQAP